MLRLTILLCFGIFAALFTLGEDRGQLRPGLAVAAAEGRLDEVWAKARQTVEPMSVPEPVGQVAAAIPDPEPGPSLPAVASTVAELAPTATGTVMESAPVREVVQAVDEPIFSLTSFGNEPVPGEDGTPVTATEDTATTEFPSSAAAPSGGTIWYVTADSVNVRSGPSTEADVLGRLGNGEATLLVAAIDGDWARIVIQGDGVEGYVALRYLSPDAP